ncbi:low molecular weight phosphatase family protein [Arenivirga flava]|uniref:Low molecular weight phosphatase family protein n=1 Tax=Arenivirga flava TaxID=1930060 RepID=A0AA37UFK1_9MICO|nr:low molecular weight phosphatase family protein [Arenivirga flava]GMA28069.1 low molecular weight phosphatase family protein [Arenivirga flava]
MSIAGSAAAPIVPDPFRILVVCTGNICRSAQGEQLLRARIPVELQGVFEIRSAGTGALVGAPMPEEAAALSRHYGGSPDAHRGQDITAELVRESDLVLAMAAEHRSGAVQLAPRASRYGFMFTEFGALLDDLSNNLPEPLLDEALPQHPLTTRLRALVRMAAGRRGFLPAEDAEPKDIVDPYRRSQQVYDESAAQVSAGVDRILNAVVRIAGQVR